MRQLTRRVVPAARWLGGRSGERLTGSVAVLSPHLDDGVFSLGAAIAASRADVSIVTVFAGDPDSTTRAGEWDARAGFGTEGEAARARRSEDELACADVHAQPVWLPFSDHQYPPAPDQDLWTALEDAVAGVETVLVPAFPLMHEDHARLHDLVARKGFPGRAVGHYVEQPYAAAWTEPGPGDGWAPLAAALPHRLAKLRACRRYASQLPLLKRSGRVLLPLVRYEAGRGGELVRWS
ncbi:MAG TPA: PIG-L family deacetylase [Gaiellaceae bacterium]